MEDRILRELHTSQVYQRLKAIRYCYEKLEKKQKLFCESFHIRCLDCNGDCCLHFVPDITETEAEFLAYGLIREEKDDLVLELLKYREGREDCCPLFIEDSDRHCAVYRFRPLICRLFGASAVRDKNGAPAFRPCKWNSDHREISEEEFREQEKAILFMSDFGEMLRNIDPERTEAFPLPEILPKAVSEIRYLLSRLEEENEPD